MSSRQGDSGGEWRALAARPGYPGFVSTVAVSRIVGAMFNTAGVVLVLDRTGSAALAGVVTAAAVLPTAFAGPWLGAWLDVVTRRRPLIVFDNLLSVGALLALLALAGHGPDWTLPLAAVLLGITRPLSTGSFASALSVLAGPELLDRASAIEATSMNLGIVVGPALAAALIGVIGVGWVVALQAALTVLVALAVAVNPSFEARGPERAESVSRALREGTRALLARGLLRDTVSASLISNSTWGLMLIVFPLYAEVSLHAGHNAGGYLWAALALGSILGTIGFAGAPSRARVGRSYAVLAASGLLWLLAHSLLAGVALVLLSGICEGPAYAGTIALRQRHAPARVRSQVLNTIQSLNQVSAAVGSIAGGLLHRPAPAFAAFCGLNLLAAAVVGRGALLARDDERDGDP